MNKEQYLQKLRENLRGLSDQETAETMQYYTEYFEDAGPEQEAGVIEELGDPADLARQAMEAAGQTMENAAQGAGTHTRSLLPGLFQRQHGTEARTIRFREADLEPFRDIFIHVRDCPITIQESPDGNYKADVALGLDEEETAEAGVVDGVFTVKTSGRPRRIVFGRSRKESRYVKLFLPAAEFSRITLRTSNSPVKADFRASIRGDLRIVTSNASIEIAGIRAAETICADSSNSGIQLRALACEKLTAHTSNGAVRTEDISCDLYHAATTNAYFSLKSSSFRKCEAATTNGTLSISGCLFSEELKAGTTNGMIAAELIGSETDYRIDAATSNASVHVNGEIRGKSCSTGSGPRKVTLGTSNGIIRVSFTQALPEKAGM